MFISNIIYKLPTIIYKSKIIYKATTAPTNKDQQPRSTNINIGSIESLYTTCSHTQHTATSLCPLLSLAHTSLIKHILVFLSLNIFLLEHQSPLLCRSPLLSKAPLQADRRVKFGTPLSYVHPDVSWFRILVRTFGAHRGVAVKHTPTNSCQSSHIHPWLALGLTSDRRPPHRVTSSSGSYDRHNHSTTTPKPYCRDGATP